MEKERQLKSFMYREKSPGLPRRQEEMFCAIRAMMREQSPQESGNKGKLLPVSLTDQPSAENLLFQKQNIWPRTFKTCSYYKD